MKRFSSIIVCLLVFCCGSDDGPGDPSSAMLIFPDNNQECNQGVVLNASQSTVTFRWEATVNTDSYEVVLTNLNTQSVSKYEVTDNTRDITLNKATPYSWFVNSTSINSTVIAVSATWRFYNSGDAVQTYAPFPAELIAPAMGLSVTGNTQQLSWSASDVDNDISEYDIYFDTVNPPLNLEQQGATATSLSVATSTGTVYFWKVITRDSETNTSESQVFQFKVD